jgi:alpha-L-rhamnosidase
MKFGNGNPMLTPHTLTCEYLSNPIGLDVPQPRLSWKSTATTRGARQTAYQIIVTTSDATLWDSGKVASDASVHVPYGGPALHAGQRCTWRVRVWEERDAASEWSETAFWEMGLLDHTNWQADWITPDWDEDITTSQPVPMLRREFKADGDMVSARLYATSLGLYELSINGQRVGDGVLTPGWTSYDHRVQYQTYDVTAMIRVGDNAIGVMLGDGWFRSFLGFEGARNTYGTRLALLAQLHLTYADGRIEVIVTDAHWHATQSPITLSDIYMGEAYDARLEQSGWAEPNFDDSAWHGVRILDHRKDIVVAQVAPFIRRHEEVKPIRIFQTPKGEIVLDFGQNMVGWVRLRARGPAGSTVTTRHFEVLDQAGNVYLTNLRSARQVVQYTLKGTADADEVFEPRFTFQGFQFISVEGFPGEVTPENFTGIVVHSDMPVTGSFECSNPMINQLQHNILWGQKGNFVDVPTDCPQRDERLGWTGDTQVFIRTACFNMQTGAFFTKWLHDVAADQLPNGSVTFVVPDVIARRDGPAPFSGAGSAAWADAAVICPWTIYQCYGDTRILAVQYDSMVGWVHYMRDHADADLIWRKGFHFGDWLDYRGSFALVPSPVTNNEIIATAFFAYSSGLLAEMARILGKIDDAEVYADLSRRVKDAFTTEFVAASGRVGPNTQTAYVLALHFDLLPEALRLKAAARLAELVRNQNFHLTTGFVGTPYLCHVLSRFGHTDVAYELLNQETYPSWLYPVKKGATTIWERWDGIKPDGSFQDAGMNSFNHYAYGAIGEWLYRVVAGIDVDAAEPGYKHIVFQPQPGGGLTHVRASVDSPYGLVASEWDLTDADFTLKVTVPANTRATVHLPASALDQITEGGRALVMGDGITGARIAGDKSDTAVIEVGAGDYAFTTSALNRAKAFANVRHVAGRLDRYSTVRELMTNAAVKAAITQHIDEKVLPANALDESFAQVVQSMPRIITPDKLAAIDAALVDVLAL